MWSISKCKSTFQKIDHTSLLDMEGGKYIFALFSELVQELLDDGNISGAISVVRKLHETTEVPFERIALDGGKSIAWISLFSDTLGDTLEGAIH